MSLIRNCLLATALTLTLAPVGSAARAELIRVETSDPASRATVEVDVEWGSIRVQGDPAAEAITIEARPDRADEMAGSPIAVSERDNRVTVAQSPIPSGSFRSAHLEITAPRGTDLELRMNRGGDIHVENIQGQVEVTNLNGSVELTAISGAAAVNASNGSIAAGFSEVDAASDMIFSSLNGSIELCLPADFTARVHLTTAGDPIRSDFEIVRDPTPRTVASGESLSTTNSEVRGGIGSGEALLRASTLNGEIHLARCD